jgi:membrane-associated protease RseP (regulator of RpoE activity)
MHPKGYISTMRVPTFIRAMLAVALLVPAAASAQEHHSERGRGWMGIGFEWEDDSPREAVVSQVFPGSAAERAGVRRGDVVLRIDGDPATESAVERLRERVSVGDTVVLRVRRDGRETEHRVVAAERRRGPVVVRGDDGDEVITVEVPSEQIRIRMDTMRAHVERLLTRVDSLHGRLELLHGDSNGVLFRVEREAGEPMRVHRGRVRVLGRDSLHRRIEIDSMVILRDSSRSRRRDAERARVEAFPYRDMDPGVPFYLEMGRRGMAGAELVEMNPGLARYFRTEHGLLVTQVSEASPMARAGIEAGDVIVRAGGAELDDVGELRRAFSAAHQEGKLRLDVIRQGNRRTVELQWEPMQWRARSPAPRAGEPRARSN